MVISTSEMAYHVGFMDFPLRISWKNWFCSKCTHENIHWSGSQAAGWAWQEGWSSTCLKLEYSRTDEVSHVSTDLFAFSLFATKWFVVESKYVKNRWCERISCQITFTIHICTNVAIEATCFDEWVLTVVWNQTSLMVNFLLFCFSIKFSGKRAKNHSRWVPAWL